LELLSTNILWKFSKLSKKENVTNDEIDDFKLLKNNLFYSLEFYLQYPNSSDIQYYVCFIFYPLYYYDYDDYDDYDYYDYDYYDYDYYDDHYDHYDYVLIIKFSLIIIIRMKTELLETP
jgi:hypothetical protein